MVSQVLGDRYEVQKQLGKNAGRQTLLARDLKTQELVVVKHLSFGAGLAWDDFTLFEREAETLKALSHPAIPRYLNYFELNLPDSKGFALVQTYVDGHSLEQQLKAGRTFSEVEVRRMAKALLEILAYLHGRQPPVIHRDIKPSNVLLVCSGSSVGQVYLVDFGSVKTLTASEASSLTVVGTYGYMPPEQFGGRTVAASDLYGLGATLITLATGTHPADLPQKDGRIQLRQVTHLTPAFARWLEWMTEPNLDQRLGSAPEALEALEQQRLRGNSFVARKPSGSKIALTKGAGVLEILIPPAGFDLGTGFLCLFAIAWNSFLVLWTGFGVFATPLGINIVFALFSLPFWGVGLSMILAILFNLFGRTRLRLDRQQISLTYELLGVRYSRPQPSSRRDINKLEYTPSFFTRDSDGDRVEIKPQIIIWSGVQKYNFGGSSLSEPELDWLAYELSDWLGLSITRE